MDNQVTEQTHSIIINNSIYTFTCTDNREHVESLKAKLSQVVEQLSESHRGQTLSDYAMKVALLLADDAVRKEISLKAENAGLHERLENLLNQLDLAL